MFYLSGRGSVSSNRKTDNEDEFGWYLGDRDRELIEDKIYENTSQILRSSMQANNTNNNNDVSIDESSSSLNSKISAFTCNDRDVKSANLSFSCDFEKRENYDYDTTMRNEAIEMNSFNERSSNVNHEIDIDMIERDADHSRVFDSSIISTRESVEKNNFVESENKSMNNNNEKCGISYTPERLVRSQEYRILAPSPRYLPIPRSSGNIVDDNKTRNYRGNRRKIGDLIDNKQFGSTHPEALLDRGAPEIRSTIGNDNRRWNRRGMKKSRDETDSSSEIHETSRDMANREISLTSKTPDPASSGSSYERHSRISWNEGEKIIRGTSQDDTSGVHSNDWSGETQSGAETPICLCDELADASRSFDNVIESRFRATAINEVVSILEGLANYPDRAEILLEEDEFFESTSGHDKSTRLALAIETDDSVPSTFHGNRENLVEIGEKIERLRMTTRNILKDIVLLRQDFQFNENKVDDLIEATIALRRDTSEMRYLDDLLNLLDGELERISRRNWPFVFGRSEHRGEDMNLVV